MKMKRNNTGAINIWTILIILFALVGAGVACYFYFHNKQYDDYIKNKEYELAIQHSPKKDTAYILFAKELWDKSNHCYRREEFEFNRDRACKVAKEGLKMTGSEELSKLYNTFTKYANNPYSVNINDDGSIKIGSEKVVKPGYKPPNLGEFADAQGTN